MIAYPDLNILWKDHLKLTTDCVKYLEIGSLHSGSMLIFHNIFGPHVHSTSINPFSNCEHYSEYDAEHDRKLKY